MDKQSFVDVAVEGSPVRLYRMNSFVFVQAAAAAAVAAAEVDKE